MVCRGLVVQFCFYERSGLIILKVKNPRFINFYYLFRIFIFIKECPLFYQCSYSSSYFVYLELAQNFGH